MYTIPKVEKLNAVQQLTATITLPSMVNMMIHNDKYRCFQGQEHGHIARHCPTIWCFECDEYGHIIMDCPHKIPPLGTPAKHHQLRLHRSHHATNHIPDTALRTGTGKAISRTQPHVITDTTAQAPMTLIQAILDHNIGIITIITGVAHDMFQFHAQEL